MLSHFADRIKDFNFDLLNRSIKSWIISILRLILITGISYLILFPLLSKISTAFMTRADLFDRTVFWIPKNFTLENFELAIIHMDYVESLLLTSTLALCVAFFQLASSTLVGYGFARYDFPFKKIFFALVLFTLIVPPNMVLVPYYMNFRFFNLYGLIPGDGLNLIGTYWPFILISLTGVGFRNGLFIFVMRQFFRGMPQNLEDAAYVDGAGYFQTFFRIMLPGAVPALVVVFLFSFVWQWNDVFFSRVFLGTVGEVDVLSIALRDLPEEIDYWIEHSPYLSLIINAGTLLVIGPLVVVYAFMQRYFVESVERTGIVG